MTSDRWRRWRTIAIRTVLVLAGLAALIVVAGLVLWWNFATSTERVTGDLREIHREVEVPASWHYVGEDVGGTAECLMGSCLQIKREYTSDLPPDHPDACPWARETVEQWGTVVADNARGPGCIVAAFNGDRRMVVSVTVDAEPTINVSPSEPALARKGDNRLSVRIECCR